MSSETLELRALPGFDLIKKDIHFGYPFLLLRARDGTRTRDPDLGKVVLHQLSHSRISVICLVYSQAQVVLYRNLLRMSIYF